MLNVKAFSPKTTRLVICYIPRKLPWVMEVFVTYRRSQLPGWDQCTPILIYVIIPHSEVGVSTLFETFQALGIVSQQPGPMARINEFYPIYFLLSVKEPWDAINHQITVNVKSFQSRDQVMNLRCITLFIRNPFISEKWQNESKYISRVMNAPDQMWHTKTNDEGVEVHRIYSVGWEGTAGLFGIWFGLFTYSRFITRWTCFHNFHTDK